MLRGYPLAHLLMKFLCLTHSAKEISLCLLPLWGDSAPLLRLIPSLALGRCCQWWVFLMPGQLRPWGCSAGLAAPPRRAGGSDPQVALPNTCVCDPGIMWYHLQPHRPPEPRPPPSLPCCGNVGTGQGAGPRTGLLLPLLPRVGTLFPSSRFLSYH